MSARSSGFSSYGHGTPARGDPTKDQGGTKAAAGEASLPGRSRSRPSHLGLAWLDVTISCNIPCRSAPLPAGRLSPVTSPSERWPPNNSTGESPTPGSTSLQRTCGRVCAVRCPAALSPLQLTSAPSTSQSTTPLSRSAHFLASVSHALCPLDTTLLWQLGTAHLSGWTHNGGRQSSPPRRCFSPSLSTSWLLSSLPKLQPTVPAALMSSPSLHTSPPEKR